MLVPDADDRALVHRVIYDELCLGVVRPESRAAYPPSIERLVAAGAEGVVLGCTEIELLVGPDDVDLPVFPTTRLHVEAALDLAARRRTGARTGSHRRDLEPHAAAGPRLDDGAAPVRPATAPRPAPAPGPSRGWCGSARPG